MESQEDIYQTQDKKFKNFVLRFFSIASIVGGLIIMLLFFVKIGKHYSISDDGTGVETVGQIGDFVGGVIGTIFSLTGVLLLFRTLRDQRESFNKQMFEARLIELIKSHRDNVSEFEIANAVRGRACFSQMISELRYIYRLVMVGAEIVRYEEKPSLNDEREYLQMAYLIMFFGIGYSSERQLFELFNDKEKHLFNSFVKDRLVKVQEAYEKKAPDFGSIHFIYDLPLISPKDSYTFEIKYYPFDGHTSRLGHYFRQLFQIVRYIDKQSSEILTRDEKYEYSKMLRAVLSNHEQQLLFYNSLSILGSEWVSDQLILKYALIKNIPLGVIDIGVHPHSVFGKKTIDGRFLFETDEIMSRNS